MAYLDDFLAFCYKQDFDGALIFLKSIFHDPDNQKIKGKPTDFLHDDSYDKKIPPSQGFDKMLENFKPRGVLQERIDFIIEILGESRNEDSDNNHRMQPFNALFFKLDIYEFGRVVIDSIHYNPENKIMIHQYGLNHEIISDSDCYPKDKSGENYDFIYDMKKKDIYSISYQGERLDGEMLHMHIKSVIFCKFLKETLITSLISQGQFAKFPKTLPFHFLFRITDSSYGEYNFEDVIFDCYQPLTQESLSGTQFYKEYIAASMLDKNTSASEKFIYLLKFFNMDKKEKGFYDLCEIIKDENEIFEIMQKLAGQSLGRFERMSGDYVHPKKYLSSKVRAILKKTKNWKETMDLPEIEEVMRSLGLLSHLEIYKSYAVDYPDGNLCRSNMELRLHDLELMEIELTGTESGLFLNTYNKIGRSDPFYFARVFWSLSKYGEKYFNEAELFQKRMFGLTPPKLPTDLEHAISLSKRFTADISDSYNLIPKKHSKGFLKLFNKCFNTMKNHPSALYRVQWHEKQFAESPDKIIHRGGWGDVVILVKNPPKGYIEAVCGLLDLMPEKFNGYGDRWNYVMERIIALGTKAAPAIPKLLRLLDKYTADRFDEQLINILGEILYKTGLEDIPPIIHDLKKRNQYYTEEYYKKWSLVGPIKRFKQFEKSFSLNADSFNRPLTWEKKLYFSPPGLEYFFEKILKHKSKKAMLACLKKAAKKTPGPVLREFLLIAADLTKSIKETKLSLIDCALDIISYLENITELDDKHSKLLLQSRMFVLVQKIENKDKAASQMIDDLKLIYKNLPILFFWEIYHTERLYGVQKAVETMIKNWKSLTAKDPVYSKAFLLYTLTPENDWKKINKAGVFGLLRIIQRKYEDRYFKNCKYNGKYDGLNSDPVEDFLKGEFRNKNEEEVKDVINSYKEEYDNWEFFYNKSNNELAAYLDKSNWNTTRQIIKHLVDEPEKFSNDILKALERYVNDEDKYLNLMSMIWSVNTIHTDILNTIYSHKYLHSFITKYRDSSSIDLAKEIFTHLNTVQNFDKVIELTTLLDDKTCIGAFKSALNAYVLSGKISEGIVWLKKILEKTKTNDPVFILISNNIGALNIHLKNYDKAEEHYKKLFSMDWSMFEYQSDKDDDLMENIMGMGNMDEEYMTQFKIYYASAHYNMACVYALTGRTEESVSELIEARKLNLNGYPRSTIEAEQDFNKISGTKEFLKYINQIQ